MAVTKNDVLVLGRGFLNDNSQGAVIFTANNIVAYWDSSYTYSQYNVVEYAGSVYRSKINSNTTNEPDVSPSAWEVLYNGTKDGDFAFIIGTGATILQRESGFWVVFGNHPAAAAFYDESIDYVASSPGAGQALGPLPPNSLVTLPLNSRNGFVQQTYVVGSGSLEVRLNGQCLRDGVDWLEVGTTGSSSDQVQIVGPVDVDDRLTFRELTFTNLTGYGYGAGGYLQEAYYNEALYVVASSPGTGQILGPISPGTNIQLPLNSRNSYIQEKYTVGSGDLQLILNGEVLEVGDDWTEVGSVGTVSQYVQIQITLNPDDKLVFRKIDASLVAIAGGGSTTLQTAYNSGASITTRIGVPFTVSGSGPGKIAVFNGDIEVTGMIDPTAVTFIRQGSNPISGQDGIWVDSSGYLHFYQNGVGDTNVSQAISGGGTAVTVQLVNNSGGTIPALSPVSLSSSDGSIHVTNPSLLQDAETFQGITPEAILNGQSGAVVVSGRIANVTTAIAVGSPLWVSLAGSIQSTAPDYGVTGFAIGDFIIKVGALAQNPTNPSQIDLIVNSSLRGQL